MVSYGDREFKEWADDLGLNDSDLKLIRSTALKRAVLWLFLGFCSIVAGVVASIVFDQNTMLCIGIGYTVAAFFIPFFNHALLFRRQIKKGMFDVKPGLFLGFCYLVQFLYYITITPLIANIFVKKGYGSGINGLIKKGKVGKNKNVESGKQSTPASKPVSSSSNTSVSDSDDPNKWTENYVKSYENRCVATLEAMTDAMNRAVKAGDYLAAVQCCDRCCNGFVLLCKCHGNDKYLPKLYTYSYINAEILLFGVVAEKGMQQGMKAAIGNLKDAYDFAVKCTKEVYRVKDKAARDAEKIAGILAELEKGSSLSSIKNKFDIDFPYDLIGY